MNLRCLAYTALFKIKQTRLIGLLVFKGGKPFRILQKNVSVTGVVLSIAGTAEDGDWCFDIKNITNYEPATFHCEATPCTEDHVHDFVARLKIGDTVKLEGDWCFDPPHFGDNGGGNEIHPIRTAEIIFTEPIAQNHNQETNPSQN